MASNAQNSIRSFGISEQAIITSRKQLIHSPSTGMNIQPTAAPALVVALVVLAPPPPAPPALVLSSQQERQETNITGMQIYAAPAPHGPSQGNRVRRRRVKRDPKVVRKSTMDYSFIWETLIIESKVLYPFPPC